MDAPVHASSSSSSFERVIGCGHVSGLLCGSSTTAGRYGAMRTWWLSAQTNTEQLSSVKRRHARIEETKWEGQYAREGRNGCLAYTKASALPDERGSFAREISLTQSPHSGWTLSFCFSCVAKFANRGCSFSGENATGVLR